MGMNIMGSYSGIDKSQIDKLMEAEKLPLIQMSNKKVTIDQQKGAWKDINTRLKTLFDKMNVLKSNSLYNSKLAKIGDEKIISASANDKAVAGTYRVSVNQVATSTKIIGNKVELNEDKKIGKEGNLVIKNNDYEFTTEEKAELDNLKEKIGKEDVKLTESEEKRFNELSKKQQSGMAEIKIEETDTLEDIADKINEFSKNHVDDKGNRIKGTGVNATVVNGRLVLEDSQSGDRDIKLDGDKDILGMEVDLATANDGKYPEIGQTSPGAIQRGQGSKYSVNGIMMESDSNNISDAVRGITINIKEVGSTTITVNEDHEKMEKAIQEFVDQYNSTMTFIDEKLKAGDPKVKDSRGALAGDSALMSLQKNLRSLVTDTMNKKTGKDKFDINAPSQIGITTKDKEGTLTFDSKIFREALKENPNGVRDFFGKEDTGFVDRFNKPIDKMISDKNGIIKTKNETFDRALKDLNKQIDNFNDKMERKEKYYIKRFTALDVAMMQAESQMSWLSNQVSAMNPGK